MRPCVDIAGGISGGHLNPSVTVVSLPAVLPPSVDLADPFFELPTTELGHLSRLPLAHGSALCPRTSAWSYLWSPDHLRQVSFGPSLLDELAH